MIAITPQSSPKQTKNLIRKLDSDDGSAKPIIISKVT